MLQELHIQNYAIIEDLVIRFDKALNIITGETGAGKSILMGALSLILGDRADSNIVLNKDRKCFVEGTFKAGNKPAVMRFLEANELDINDELVIRREIAVSGKSRAFVNDTPVTLTQLNELSLCLVDLHRQFDTLSLGEAGFQLAVMDAMAGTEQDLGTYRKNFRAWQRLQLELTELVDRKSRENRELDYHQYLFNELEEAAFRENEIEETEQELELLNCSEGIKSALGNIYDELKGSEIPVVQTIKQLFQQLQPYTEHQHQLADLSARLHSVQIELADIASEAGTIGDRIGFDAERIDHLNERLNVGYKLLKKHGVQSTADLLKINADLAKKLQTVVQLDDQILKLEQSVKDSLTALQNKGANISAARKKQIGPFEKKVNELLNRVGMPNARIRVDLSPVAPTESGMDAIDFLFDANKSNQFSPIRKVASGGELSRLMLCIKSLVAGKMDLPTLIFDEIDTGISGEASLQVGQIMKELAGERQVICITHQPQIAGRADLHFFVYKEPAGSKVNTNVKVLNKEERIVAIARMLGGEKPSAAALENAREMVIN